MMKIWPFQATQNLKLAEIAANFCVFCCNHFMYNNEDTSSDHGLQNMIEYSCSINTFSYYISYLVGRKDLSLQLISFGEEGRP